MALGLFPMHRQGRNRSQTRTLPSGVVISLGALKGDSAASSIVASGCEKPKDAGFLIKYSATSVFAR
jgi:hypothetical protein